MSRSRIDFILHITYHPSLLCAGLSVDDIYGGRRLDGESLIRLKRPQSIGFSGRDLQSIKYDT